MPTIPYENIYRGDLQVVKACRSGEVINKAYRNGDLIYYNMTKSTPVPPTPSAIVLVEHLGNTNNQGKTINNNFYLFDSGLTTITTTDYDFTGIKSICHRWDGFYQKTPVASLGNRAEYAGCLDTIRSVEIDCSTVEVINYPFGNDRENNVSQTLTSVTFNNTDNVTYLGNCFYFNRNLVSVKLGDLSGVGTVATIVLFNEYNTAVTDFNVDNLPSSMNINWGFQYCTALTVNSLVNILTALPVISVNRTITIGTTNFNKLSSQQLQIATNKGWTVV